jgi:lysyl-tRNA synthetase class 1
MHWADYTALTLKERGGIQVCASGITPSGEFHIGHIREILSAEMIHRACLDLGLESKYIFIVDSMDPLRRVYDFLSPDYKKYIGVPLAFIPAPDQNGLPTQGGISYAEYFLNPFLASLEKIGVKPEIVMNHEVYKNGKFAEKIDILINKKDEIKKIIETISGRELPPDWFPYSPIGSNGSMDGVKVTGYDNPYVFWIDCNGIKGKSNINKAEGKLPWRLDWAARWIIHGITSEPAGKDHGSAGGSYDTGIPICKLLGGTPPKKMIYEWIQIKGMGPMSSSKGVTIGPVEALDLVPPQILRYAIARSKINRHIDFDTGDTLFEMADEYERILSETTKDTEDELTRRQEIARKTNNGALRLSQVNRGDDPKNSWAGVSFRHLALLAQIKNEDTDVWVSLRKSGHITKKPTFALEERLIRMRNWINGPHFPEDSKIQIQKEVTEDAVENLTQEQVNFLTVLKNRLEKCEWKDSIINNEIREVAKAVEIEIKEAFVAIYWLLINKNNGPKIVSIISELERSEVVDLFRTISKNKSLK